MQETVMFGIIIVIAMFFATMIYTSSFESSLYSSLSSISKTTYGNLDSILNISNESNFSCTNPLETFTVTNTGLIQMKSFLPYKDAQEFTGGIPNKGIIYYSGQYMFIVSPYPIQPGTYSNSKICIIPSKSASSVLIVESDQS
jgi:hypothetical protein